MLLVHESAIDEVAVEGVRDPARGAAVRARPVVLVAHHIATAARHDRVALIMLLLVVAASICSPAAAED